MKRQNQILSSWSKKWLDYMQRRSTSFEADRHSITLNLTRIYRKSTTFTPLYKALLKVNVAGVTAAFGTNLLMAKV